MNTGMYLPESFYHVDSKMTFGRLKYAENKESPVTGFVTQYIDCSKSLRVYLGGGIYGEMPIDEATIYDLYKSNRINLSPNITYLIGETVRVRVMYTCQAAGIVRLSRKQHMLSALEVLSCATKFNNAVVSSISHPVAYIDVGAGLLGRILPKEMSGCTFSDLEDDVNLRVGDTLKVSVLEYNSFLKKFELSRVKALPPLENVVAPGDIVVCRIFDKVPNQENDSRGIGFFVTINDYLPGILDSPTELDYGSTVVATVKKTTELGAKLNFMRLLTL